MLPPNYIEQYYEEIEKGRIQAPQTIKVVYKRELDRIYTAGQEYYFDIERGTKPIRFIEKYCKHSKGDFMGKPVELELFQKAKIQLAFGILERDTDLRRFREVGDIRGRKNGKSTESAGIIKYMLYADGEGGPEIYCVANKLDQSKLIFNECVAMRLQSPSFRELSRKRQSDIYTSFNFGTIKPISADTRTADGYNASFFVQDEWHEADTGDMYDLMKQSQTARKQPMAWLISTNGKVREKFFDQQYEFYRNVALGVIENDRILPLIYELDSREEWTDERMWEKANPGLGTIKSLETLRDNVEMAKQNPRFQPTVMAKDFNIPETSSDTWLNYDEIVNRKCEDLEELEHSYAIGGCDLSATKDLTCATLVIRKPNNPNYYVLQQYFMPQSKFDNAKEKKGKEAPYELWEKQGWLTVCKGALVDYGDVTKWFVKMVKVHDIRPLWIGYDRALASYWVQEMESYGFSMLKVAQGGYTWSQPMKDLGGKLEEKRVIYQDNPMLRWCLFNTGVTKTSKSGLETIMPSKIQEHRRIDGTISLLNAWTVMFNREAEYIGYLR